MAELHTWVGVHDFLQQVSIAPSNVSHHAVATEVLKAISGKSAAYGCVSSIAIGCKWQIVQHMAVLLAVDAAQQQQL